ncbi:MAG: gliding motility-associated C-terminal domain-containing protein [Bacteroidia bacterium]|nr:gliding motility-associated C-terminal domain-containing protein [Bacteroidia bacterium]
MKNKLCIIIMFVLASIQGQAQLTVTSGNPVNAIVDSLVGTGVTVSNVTYTGNASARGLFSCAGGCNLGIAKGIFLSTGNAGQTPTSPPSDFHSTDLGASGDAQLNTIVSPQQTFDATVLEFDFTPAADSIGFRFVFGSEEYNEFVNAGFNDVFAFYISGPGIVGSKNLALIPSTTIPVSIDNVNNGNSGGVATGPCTNCAYYTDNVANGGGAIFFDGFTHVINAGIAVLPCQTYHMKFAIADVGDGVYDSGVFLEAKSFTSIGNLNMYANGALCTVDTIYACHGDSVILSASNTVGGVTWNNGATTQSIVVTEANITPTGVYQYAVVNLAAFCFASSKQVKIIFTTPTATITPLGSTNLCPGGSVDLEANAGNSYLWSTGETTQTITVSTAGTYIVTVYETPTCFASDTISVTVAAPTASISGVTTICSGQATTLTATAGNSYIWSNGATSQSITVSSATTYTVTVTYPGGCTASASVAVTANTNPTPSITGNNSICQGQSSTLSAGSYTSYQWSTGSTSANISANTSGIYTVTVTDANGCTGSTTFNLTVNPNPSPAITGTTAFCQGANSTLSAGGGYASYLWSTGAVTPTLNVTTGGTYSVTVTNAYGCSASASLPITVYSLPAPVINGPAGICPGASAALTTGSFAAYVWSTGSNTQTINTNVPGTYAVTVTDANGCIDSVSYTLAAYTNPTPVITGTAAICQNQSSLLDAGSFTSYNWSTGASTQTISVTQSGTYSVTVTNSNGCSAAASFAVLVNPLPTPAITGINAFCSGDSSQLTVTGNYPSYLWSTGASSSAVTVNAGGNYVVTVTDANGCTASASQSITVWSLPSPVISGDNNICIGETATLSTGNYASYQWSTGASTDSISTTTAGNYIVTVTDMNGCVNTSAPFNVAVHQLPSAIVSGTTAICVGQSTPVQIDITGTPPFRYGYTDGSTAFGPFTTSNSTVTIPVAPTSATTYTLNLITDLYCNGNFGGSAAITVNPLPQPVITGPSAICENETALLNAGAFAAYQWSTGENTAFINANTNGNYTCTVTSAVGCVNSANFYLTVNPLPVVTFTNDSSLTCEVPRIHFTNTSVYPAGSVFSWNFGDAVSSEMNPVHQYDSSGTYPVTLIITTPAGCVDSSTQNVDITIFPLPLAQFDVSPDFAPLYNSTIELKDNSENAVTWHWDFGDGQKSDIPVSQYQYQSPGKYTITLQITNIAGCESVTSREVFITPFFIPNAFTPNGDGKNETFYDPGYAFDVSSVTMRIWNRWGQMVFSSDNMSHVWDGKDASGNDAPQGVYYYTLKVVQNSGHENDYAGSVTLVR